MSLARPERTNAPSAAVVVADFGASYLFLDKSRSPALFQYATADPRFVSRHDSEAFAIFSLK